MSFVDTVIFSVDGKPALDLRVSTPREISARGRSTLGIVIRAQENRPLPGDLKPSL